MYLNICFEMLQREAKSAQSDIGTEQNNDKIPIHPSRVLFVRWVAFLALNIHCTSSLTPASYTRSSLIIFSQTSARSFAACHALRGS